MQLNQSPVQFVHNLGLGIELDFDLGRRLVNQVDSLVRQEAVGNVAVAQLGRRDDGRVGDIDAVVHLVALLEAPQNRHGGFHGGLTDQDFLEAALQRGVFFDVLAVFIEGGGTHAMELAAGQRGLEHIAGIHGALGLASAHHGVQFINKNNGLALILRQVFEHVFQALFELAPELGTGQQRGHVQRQHALAFERIRHLPGHDALGQALHDGGFPDARLADEHRVVLGAPLQHLDGAADFVVPADHRVELASPGALGQVHAVFFERFALILGVCAVHALPAAHGRNGCVQAFAVQAQRLHRLGKVGFGLAQRHQKQLAGDKLVAALDGLFFGGLQQADHVASDLHLFLALHLGQFFHGRVRLRQQHRHVDASALQQGFGPVLLAQHGRQHVAGLDIGMVLAQGGALGFAQRFLEFGGQFVNSHGAVLRLDRSLGPLADFQAKALRRACLKSRQ